MDFILQQKPINNPQKLPLNELNLVYKMFRKVKKIDQKEDLDKLKTDLNKNYDVRVEKVPAISDKWIEKTRPYAHYQPYFPEVPQEENDQFFSRNKQYLETIDFLLGCRAQQFWCYVVHEKKIEQVLKSFILNCMPWYELHHLNDKVLEMQCEVHEKVARIYERLLTRRESDQEYLTPSAHLRYVKESNLLSFTVVMRLCLLYKCFNQNLINTALDFFMETNKNTCYGDIKQFIQQALLALETLMDEICEGTKSKSNTLLIGQKPLQFDPCWYSDAILLLLDTAANLNALLTSCPLAVDIANGVDTAHCVTFFYEKTFLTLYELLSYQKKFALDWSELKDRIYDQISLSRSELTNCFHVFVSETIDNIIKARGDVLNQDKHLEHYIRLITMALDKEHFVFDYHHSYEIDIQLQMISDFYPDLDKMRTNYIMKCLSNIPQLDYAMSNNENDKLTNGILAHIPPSSVKSAKTGIMMDEKKAWFPSEDEIEAMIKDVLDMLPDLGDGFVLQCLQVYDYNTSEVIAALLDNNLSPLLQDIKRDEIRIPPEPQPKQPILAYRGKKPTYADTKQLLDEKTDITKKYLQRKPELTFDMYDDEFDDRYDYSEPMPQSRVKEEDKDPYEYMVNRFDAYEIVSDPSDSSGGEEQVAIANKPTKSFCQDPALVREQREALRKGRGGGGSRDVIGKAKGQGQEKNVQQNRDKKNANKSSKGNHNRKSGATFKRNKGMIPS